MIPPISHGSSSTVIALTLPETGSEGTLLIQRGDLAHMSQFAHTSETNFDALIQQAVTALAVVESEPPVIPDPPRCKTTPKVAPPSEPPEPVFQVPTRMKKGRKTTTIPTRCLDIVDGEAAQEAALKVAGRLLDSGLWDGKMRDELLNDEIFYSLTEAQVLIEDWR